MCFSEFTRRTQRVFQPGQCRVQKTCISERQYEARGRWIDTALVSTPSAVRVTFSSSDHNPKVVWAESLYPSCRPISRFRKHSCCYGDMEIRLLRQFRRRGVAWTGWFHRQEYPWWCLACGRERWLRLGSVLAIEISLSSDITSHMKARVEVLHCTQDDKAEWQFAGGFAMAQILEQVWAEQFFGERRWVPSRPCKRWWS